MCKALPKVDREAGSLWGADAQGTRERYGKVQSFTRPHSPPRTRSLELANGALDGYSVNMTGTWTP